MQWLVQSILWLHLACVTQQVIAKSSPIALITYSGRVLHELHTRNYGNDGSFHIFCYFASD